MGVKAQRGPRAGASSSIQRRRASGRAREHQGNDTGDDKGEDMEVDRHKEAAPKRKRGEIACSSPPSSVYRNNNHNRLTIFDAIVNGFIKLVGGTRLVGVIIMPSGLPMASIPKRRFAQVLPSREWIRRWKSYCYIVTHNAHMHVLLKLELPLLLFRLPEGWFLARLSTLLGSVLPRLRSLSRCRPLPRHLVEVVASHEGLSPNLVGLAL